MDQYAHIEAQLLAKQAELTRRLERLKDNLTARPKRGLAGAGARARERRGRRRARQRGAQRDQQDRARRSIRSRTRPMGSAATAARRFRWRGSSRSRSRTAASAVRPRRSRPYAAANLALGRARSAPDARGAGRRRFPRLERPLLALGRPRRGRTFLIGPVAAHAWPAARELERELEPTIVELGDDAARPHAHSARATRARAADRPP